MQWDASNVEILVYTFREGLLAAVGHDLCLRATKLTVDVGDNDAIVCEVDAASLRASGVSPDDARKIEKNAADDVLAARRFPRSRSARPASRATASAPASKAR